MNAVQRIFKNTASLFLGDVVSKILLFISIIYLARVLGPGDFGKISFAMSLVVYFSIVANLGLPLLGTREIAKDKNKINNYLGSILTLRLFLTSLCFGLLLILIFILNRPPELNNLLVIYGLGLIPTALLIDWVFQGMEKMEYIGLSRILSSAIYLGLVLYFVSSSNELVLIPCFHILANSLAVLLLFYIFAKHIGGHKFKLNLNFWPSLFKATLPIGIATLLTHSYQGIDIVMLGFIKGTEEVGHFSAAYRIIFFIVMVIGAYSNSIYPMISNYYRTSFDSFKQIILSSNKLMVSIMLPLAVGGTIISKPLIYQLYGEKYDNAVLVFQILIWILFIMSMNVARGWGLLACDRQKQYSKGTAVAVVGNITLNLILIPHLGAVGASIARVLAEVIAFTVYHIEFCKIVRVPFAKPIIRPLIASVSMGLFIYLNIDNPSFNLILLVVSGSLIYLIIFILLKGITKKEINYIRQAVSR